MATPGVAAGLPVGSGGDRGAFWHLEMGVVGFVADTGRRPGGGEGCAHA